MKYDTFILKIVIRNNRSYSIHSVVIGCCARSNPICVPNWCYMHWICTTLNLSHFVVDATPRAVELKWAVSCNPNTYLTWYYVPYLSKRFFCANCFRKVLQPQPLLVVGDLMIRLIKKSLTLNSKICKLQFFHEGNSSWREVINANKSKLIKLQLIPLSSHDLKTADSFYFHRTLVSRSPKNSSN